MDGYVQKVWDTIHTHGWALQGVFATRENPSPPFTYTIGLSFLDHPELIIFGINHDNAAAILNELGRRIRDEGLVLEDRHRDDTVLVGLDVELRAVPRSAHSEYFGVANRILGRGKFKALQIVWPDPEGKLPWEPGYDEKFKAMQPLLDADWERRN